MPPSSLPPQKKRKLASSDSSVKKIDSFEALFNKALAEDGSLNCFLDLLELARSTSDAAVLHKALYALYRCSVSITASRKIDLSKCRTEESKVVRGWLLDRVGEYTDLLCGLMLDEEKALRAASLQILMSMLKHLSTAFSNASGTPQIYSVHFRKIVSALLLCSPRPGGSTSPPGGRKVEVDVRDTFVETWLSSYDDIRWFFFRDATTMLRSLKGTETTNSIAENLLSFLERLKTMPTESAELDAFWIPELGVKPPKPSRDSKQQGDILDEPIPVDEDDWRTFFDDDNTSKPTTSKSGQPRVHTLSTHQSLHSLASHRAQFSSCWMTLLPHIASSSSLAARALALLHRGVMPHMDKPVRLMDWVGGCVDFGGSIGLLALNALFTLIKDYNLDFPDFYTRLYAFLTRDVMHLKYRARFFRLTDIFLSSTHLPVTILASFIKRLSRLSLSAPPAAIVMIIPFVYNILKRHPALMVMIHRVDEDSPEIDPFNETELSPLRTNALESSLWELVSHRDHYLSSVSTLAKIFSEAFTKPAYALEDFLDHTYATLLETEVKRKLKKDPAVALELSSSLFPISTSEEVQATRDVVSELW
ncbi:CBF-domain-containing protein, partial [Ceratobasidium sp. AG-I]